MCIFVWVVFKHQSQRNVPEINTKVQDVRKAKIWLFWQCSLVMLRLATTNIRLFFTNSI